MSTKKIIMLTGQGKSSTYMYNGLKDEFAIATVIVENKGNRKNFLKRRIKKLGYFKVFGQMLFQAIVPRILEATSQKRIDEIKSAYKLDGTPIPSTIVKVVPSVNSAECIEFLQNERPDLIIVNGTKIIIDKVLNCTEATFINTHVGITPKYRGVHGGYWSIVNRDLENCGVTVHLVDTGIDTGGVLYQKTIAVNKDDNFVTYTFLQIGEGIALMKRAIVNFINGDLKPIASQSSTSKLYSHPTLWFYIRKRMFNGVK